MRPPSLPQCSVPYYVRCERCVPDAHSGRHERYQAVGACEQPMPVPDDPFEGEHRIMRSLPGMHAQVSGEPFGGCVNLYAKRDKLLVGLGIMLLLSAFICQPELRPRSGLYCPALCVSSSGDLRPADMSHHRCQKLPAWKSACRLCECQDVPVKHGSKNVCNRP